ncbi:hypothetical protein ACFE04_024676 [Oxalis oulophora]
MRPTPGEALFNLSLLYSPPPPPSSNISCRIPHECGHTSNQLEANAAMVLIVLLCALICALALNAAIRCFVRSSPSDQTNMLPGSGSGRKATRETGVPLPVVAETVVYIAGMKGVEECAICLTEFIEGETLEVLGRCKHGFHEQCIQSWLCSHYSCPTCRTSCLVLSSSSSSQDDHQASLPSISISLN